MDLKNFIQTMLQTVHITYNAHNSVIYKYLIYITILSCFIFHMDYMFFNVYLFIARPTIGIRLMYFEFFLNMFVIPTFY